MPERHKEKVMAIEQVDRSVVTQEPTATGRETVQTERRSITSMGPNGSELARRVVVLLFGLVQIVIGARIVLLALDAREANALVSAVLNISQVFVAPFEGILRTDSLHAAGSVIDITAIVAFVGWTILELIVLWVVGIWRREPASGTV
jgi:YGGT family